MFRNFLMVILVEAYIHLTFIYFTKPLYCKWKKKNNNRCDKCYFWNCKYYNNCEYNGNTRKFLGIDALFVALLQIPIPLLLIVITYFILY